MKGSPRRSLRFELSLTLTASASDSLEPPFQGRRLADPNEQIVSASDNLFRRLEAEQLLVAVRKLDDAANGQ
jgi:hypothetical protein